MNIQVLFLTKLKILINWLFHFDIPFNTEFKRIYSEKHIKKNTKANLQPQVINAILKSHLREAITLDFED